MTRSKLESEPALEQFKECRWNVCESVCAEEHRQTSGLSQRWCHGVLTWKIESTKEEKMAWYDTAPIVPDEEVKYLGRMLEMLGAPLMEKEVKRLRSKVRFYSALTARGEIGVTVGKNGSGIFFCPVGAGRFVDIWDWEECTLGKSRPKNSNVVPLRESVDWILGVLQADDHPSIDLELLEEIGKKEDRRIARERRFNWFLLAVGYIVGVYLFASSMESGRAWTGVTAGLLLMNMIVGTLNLFGCNIKRWFGFYDTDAILAERRSSKEKQAGRDRSVPDDTQKKQGGSDDHQNFQVTSLPQYDDDSPAPRRALRRDEQV